jgi:AcrR family transcriptional regulator
MTPTGRRRKVEVRREEILVATLAQIESRGMAAVRVSDVAAALGVSTALVFYHFDTKDSLLVAAFEFAVARDLRRLNRQLSRGRDPVDRLRRVISSYGPSPSDGWALWFDAWATAIREPTIRKALRRLDDRWRSALSATIREGVESGEFVCPDPTATLARVGALYDGLSVAVLVYGNVTRTQLKAWLREALAAELAVDPARLGAAPRRSAPARAVKAAR